MVLSPTKLDVTGFHVQQGLNILEPWPHHSAERFQISCSHFKDSKPLIHSSTIMQCRRHCSCDWNEIFWATLHSILEFILSLPGMIDRHNEIVSMACLLQSSLFEIFWMPPQYKCQSMQPNFISIRSLLLFKLFTISKSLGTCPPLQILFTVVLYHCFYGWVEYQLKCLLRLQLEFLSNDCRHHKLKRIFVSMPVISSSFHAALCISWVVFSWCAI